MEYNAQKYQFNQDNKDYVVSTGLVGDRIRITCQESLALDGPFYSNEFSLNDLRHANQFFLLTQTPEDALAEINKGIERQKSGLSPGINDTMSFIGYLVIGTDNDVYNLPLRRDYEPNKYGIFTPPSSGAADLVLPSNYQVDGGRLNLAEKNCVDLQREETALEEELNALIPEINNLRKISMNMKEENALIKERLKLLQVQLDERKRRVFKLKDENENLKRENQELNNYIKNQEAALREKQALQKTIKVKVRPNITHGKSAITSKFEQSALRTFLPRTVVKPITEDYYQSKIFMPSKMENEIKPPIIEPAPISDNIISTTSSDKILEPKYLPTIYKKEKVILEDEHPDVGYSMKPNIGDDLEFSSKQYTTNTYEYPKTNQTKKVISYRSKIPDVNYMENVKNVPYTSNVGKTFNKDNDISYKQYEKPQMDLPYTNIKTTNDVKEVPYTNYKGNVPYTNYKGNVPYTNYKGNVPYTNYKGDTSYSHQTAKVNNAKNVSYSNYQPDLPYTSKVTKMGGKNDYYSSAKLQGNQNNTNYTSHMAKTGYNYNQDDEDLK